MFEKQVCCLQQDKSKCPLLVRGNNTGEIRN
jgi:hypothetical protein